MVLYGRPYQRGRAILGPERSSPVSDASVTVVIRISIYVNHLRKTSLRSHAASTDDPGYPSLLWLFACRSHARVPEFTHSRLQENAAHREPIRHAHGVPSSVAVCRRAPVLLLAFVTAFALAPFQHIHRDEVSGGHHTHAPLIHSHLYPHSQHHVDKPGEQEIESSDEDGASSLDSFTLVLTADFRSCLSRFACAGHHTAPSGNTRQFRADRTARPTPPPPETRLPEPLLSDLPLEHS